MTRNIRGALPATIIELAAEFEITPRLANAYLQKLKRMGLVRRTHLVVTSQAGRRGCAPAIWERA